MGNGAAGLVLMVAGLRGSSFHRDINTLPTKSRAISEKCGRQRGTFSTPTIRRE